MLSDKIRSWCLPALFVCALSLSGTRAVAGPGLGELLERSGRGVELFWQQIGSFTCMEHVTQEKIGKHEKVEYKKDTLFDYLALPKEQEEFLTLEEMRTSQKEAAKKSNEPAVLSTNGFPTLLLIFHPQYRPNYRYQMEVNDSGDGKLTVLVVALGEVGLVMRPA